MVVSSAANVLWKLARRQSMKLLTAAGRTGPTRSSDFLFNYKSGCFAWRQFGDITGHVELVMIRRRFRALQIVRTDRHDESGTCMILAASGCDDSAIAPALTVNCRWRRE